MGLNCNKEDFSDIKAIFIIKIIIDRELMEYVVRGRRKCTI